MRTAHESFLSAAEGVDALALYAAVAAACLCYAGYQDIKARRVSGWVWLPCLAASAFALLGSLYAPLPEALPTLLAFALAGLACAFALLVLPAADALAAFFFASSWLPLRARAGLPALLLPLLAAALALAALALRSKREVVMPAREALSQDFYIPVEYCGAKLSGPLGSEYAWERLALEVLRRLQAGDEGALEAPVRCRYGAPVVAVFAAAQLAAALALLI